MAFHREIVEVNVCLIVSLLIGGLTSRSCSKNVLKRESDPIAGCLYSLLRYLARPSHLSWNTGQARNPLLHLPLTLNSLSLGFLPRNQEGEGTIVPDPLYFQDRAECR